MSDADATFAQIVIRVCLFACGFFLACVLGINECHASAYFRGHTVTTNLSAHQILPLKVTDIDSDSSAMYGASDGRITIPETGTYAVRLAFSWNMVNCTHFGVTLVNDATDFQLRQSNYPPIISSFGYVTAEFLLPQNKGDKFYVQLNEVNCTSNGSITMGSTGGWEVVGPVGGGDSAAPQAAIVGGCLLLCAVGFATGKR